MKNIIIKKVNKYDVPEERDGVKTGKINTYLIAECVNYQLMEYKSPILQEAYDVVIKHEGLPSVFLIEEDQKKIKDKNGKEVMTEIVATAKFVKDFKLDRSFNLAK